MSPEKVFHGRLGRMAQRPLSAELVPRVVYEERDNKFVVVTVYPAEKGEYP